MTLSDNLYDRFTNAISVLPLIAILRGIRVNEAVETGLRLYESGFRLMEIPLNSPDPFASIAALRGALPADALVGAGTVLETGQIDKLVACGGELAVMPHADAGLIRAAKGAGLVCVPGIITTTEAFMALAAGADALKIFPAELVSPAILKAINVVLPKGTRLFPVGGITPDNMKPYMDVGVTGFGLGSALYKPGMSPGQTAIAAQRFIAAWRTIAAN